MTVLYYIVCAGAVALGLAAAWISGRDVGYRNALREQELLDSEEDALLNRKEKDA